MTTYSIPPTVLYIKQHSVTKLKYFGKTTQDPLKYKGSGVDWKLHLKEYGSEHIITTIVFGPCTDSEVISKWAIEFSIKNNIVKSDKYANRKIENGLDGAPSGPTGKPSKKKSKPSGPTGKQRNPSKNASPKKGKPNGKKGEKRGPHSTERKQNISDAKKKKGTPAWNKGILTGPNGKKGHPTGPNASRGTPKPKVECPHCGLVGGINNMKRYHFDNCKKKP